MPIIQADYKTTLSTNLSSVATTFNVASPPDLTEGCLCINRGQDTEEWVYMSSVAADTITVSHRGLSKTSGTLTEVAGNKNQHFAGETVEWVNHPVHIINKRGDTVYGNLLLDGTSEIQFGTDATNIKDNAGSLELEDASGTIALSDIASTSTKLDDFAACDDNTDLNADTARHGLMQKYPGGTSAFLREDGNWATPSGAGNVSTSDSSATDNAIVREDGTGGTTIQKSLATIDDSGSINIPSGETYNINGTALSKGDVGLGNVDNTSDATKNAASVTLTNKTLTSPVINSPSGIVKGDVGLGSVGNYGIASEAEAQAGTSNVKYMTPLRTKDAINNNVAFGERWSLVRYGSQLISNATATDIQWNAAEVYDTNNFHSTSTNIERVTIPSGLGGIYLVTGSVIWEASVATAGHTLQLKKNGSSIETKTLKTNISNVNLNNRFTFTIPLSAGDYITINVQQNTGSSLNILAMSDVTQFLGVRIAKV